MMKLQQRLPKSLATRKEEILKKKKLINKSNTIAMACCFLVLQYLVCNIDLGKLDILKPTLQQVYIGDKQE